MALVEEANDAIAEIVGRKSYSKMADTDKKTYISAVRQDSRTAPDAYNHVFGHGKHNATN